MFRLYYKKIFSSRSLSIIYLLALVIILLIVSEFFKVNNDVKVAIAVVDLAESSSSQQYISNLSKNNLLLIKEMTMEKSEKAMANGSVDAILTIPEKHFEKASSKLKLKYLKSKQELSALVDVLALPLMPDIMAEQISLASQRYKYPADLKADYLERIDRLGNNIEVEMIIDMQQFGTESEKSIKLRESNESQLLIALFMTIVLVIYPSVNLIDNDSKVEKRLRALPTSNIIFFINKQAALLLYDLLPCAIIVFAISNNLKLKVEAVAILFLLCLNILLFLRLIITLCFELFEQTTAAFLSMAFLLTTAIIGGVFFDASLMPKIAEVGSYLPFGTIKKAMSELFYQGLNSQWAVYSLAIYIGVNVILLLFNFRRKYQKI